MRRSPLGLAVSVFTLCIVAQSSAFGAPTKVDPAVLRVLKTGIVSPLSLHGARPQPGTASVLLSLSAGSSPTALSALRHPGIRVLTPPGQSYLPDRAVAVKVSQEGLSVLVSRADVTRISLAPVSGLLPLDRSAVQLGLNAARGARPQLGDLTGKGILIGDLDSNADVFQPQFFFGDGGYFDWIDVDGDGVLTPGKDAIDLDRDGKVGASEAARLVRAETMSPMNNTPVAARSPGFDPAIDWLFLDTNGNGLRDFGAKAGFDDAVPALGEPLFVPDDVNGNGKLDRGERLVRLGTSKFRKIFVHLESPATKHVYVRGKDLSTHTNEFTGGGYGYSDALHGTGVLSIAAGDVPLVGRRWVGVAPDAEIVLGWEVAQSTAESINWILSEKPEVLLHETANWTGIPLDGSDAYSAAVDESTVKQNISHSCPVGNTGTARKHAHLEIASGQSSSTSFSIPMMGTGMRYVQMSLNIRGSSSVGVGVTTPSGEKLDLIKGAQYGLLKNGTAYYVTIEQTSRGTYFVDLILYNEKKPLETGTYPLAITGSTKDAVTVDGYLSDELSGWGQGAAWPSSLASDDRTIGVPATSDHCIAVGAHTGHAVTASEPWFGYPGGDLEVRYYSGRGPRIDGILKPDVTAPDNPWAATVSEPGSPDYGSVAPFGGTSGAGPHVTGVTALLAQAGIRGDAAREAIRKGASADTHTGTIPNHDYGHGRLNAAGALSVALEGMPPTIELKAPKQAKAGASFGITPVVVDPDGQGSSVQIRWDDDYDGSWDTQYAAVAARTVTKNANANQGYKVRVRDAQGRVAEAIAWISLEPDLPDAGPDAQDASADAAEDAQDTGADAQDAASDVQDAASDVQDAASDVQDASADVREDTSAEASVADGGASDAGKADSSTADASADSKAPVQATAAPASDDDDGCGCRTAGNAAGQEQGWLGVLLAAGLYLRRRRQGRHTSIS